MRILEDIYSYVEILENVCNDYDKLEYYQNMKDNYKLISKFICARQDKFFKKEINRIINDYEIYKKIKFNYSEALKYNKLNLRQKFNNQNLIIVTMEEFLNIIFMNFNKDFSNFVYNEYKSGKILLVRRNKEDGTCYTIESFGKDIYYYVCKFQNRLNYFDLTTIIHELSHGYISLIAPYSNIFDEVYSIFNELRLKDIIFKDKNLINDTKKFDIEYLKRISMDNKNFKLCLKNIDKLNDKTNDSDILYTERFENYVIANILALKLFYQDLEDTELAHYNVNKIYSEHFFDICQINGLEQISLEEIISCEPIKRYVKEVNLKWNK